MWFLDDDFFDFLVTCWKGFNFTGCVMVVMTRKLKALKILLREWNKEVFRNVNDKVEQAQNSLEVVLVYELMG